MTVGRVIAIIGAVLIIASITGCILVYLRFGRIYFFDSALIASVATFLLGLSDIRM